MRQDRIRGDLVAIERVELFRLDVQEPHLGARKVEDVQAMFRSTRLQLDDIRLDAPKLEVSRRTTAGKGFTKRGIRGRIGICMIQVSSLA
jgi:hypothetical protein